MMRENHPTAIKATRRETSILLDSVALQRLIEEVRQAENGNNADTTLYNRTYHRHNR